MTCKGIEKHFENRVVALRGKTGIDVFWGVAQIPGFFEYRSDSDKDFFCGTAEDFDRFIDQLEGQQ